MFYPRNIKLVNPFFDQQNTVRNSEMVKFKRSFIQRENGKDVLFIFDIKCLKPFIPENIKLVN